MFNPVSNDDVAQRYLEECLESGGTLSHKVLAAIRVWKGRWYVLGVRSSKTPVDFYHGGIDTIGDSVQLLAEVLSVETLLHDKAVVLDYFIATRGDPFLTTFRVQPTYSGKEVYFVFRAKTSGKSLENFFAHDVNLDGLITFIVSNDVVEVEKNEIQNIDRICNSVSTVIVRAFDGEAFLAWTRE